MAETFDGKPAEFLQLRSRVRATVLDLHLTSRPHTEPTLLVVEREYVEKLAELIGLDLDEYR